MQLHFALCNIENNSLHPNTKLKILLSLLEDAWCILIYIVTNNLEFKLLNHVI